MNFYSHAVVASALDVPPRAVLGAMLPDFASMGGVRLPPMADPDTAAGVALHHRTDDAFHRHPAFVAACSAGLAQLDAAGVPRGPARAAAHVGYELLLDGVLASRPEAQAAYRAALEHAAQWPAPELSATDRDALRQLARRLLTAPVPDAYRDLDFTVARLQAMLAPRPRLALADAHLAAVRGYCAWAQQEAARDARTLLAAMVATCGPTTP